MAKRYAWTALAGLATTSLVSSPLWAAPPDSLPAGQLDWQPWGDDRPAGTVCRGYYVEPDYRLPAPAIDGQVNSESNTANYGTDGDTVLDGEVILRKGDTQLEATRVQVPPERDLANASGPLTLRDKGLLVRGDSAQVSLDSDQATIDSAHYVAHEARLRGVLAGATQPAPARALFAAHGLDAHIADGQLPALTAPAAAARAHGVFGGAQGREFVPSA
ncbi:MAG: hypothetical protein VX259_10510, partial [Pseudomonadota bacterium]|nr:hypothetical protein [Pseudomonadota bacterium]